MSNPFGALGTDSDSEVEDEKIERLPQKGAAKENKKAVKNEPLPKSAEDLKARETKDLKDKKALPAQKKYIEKHQEAKNAPAGAPDKGGKRPPKREYDRKSGTGRGKEVAKSGAGGNNWGKDSEKDVIADSKAVEDEVAKEASAPEGAEGAAPPAPEEPQGMTLEEYEALRASKRQGKAFAELAPRKITEAPKGVAYKKDDKPEEVLIKLSKETEEEREQRIKKDARTGTQRVELSVMPVKKESSSSSAESPRGGSRGGMRGGRGRPFVPRTEGGAPRTEGASPRAEGGAPRGRGAPRGGAPNSSRGSFRGDRAGAINTQDESAFPKLGA